ncbi:MAG TPA: phosphotransferase family protein [Acidimicrobiales bacterium]|nr:phosphotransferase family protein [Acidimicrobiales bacterium]
MADDTRRTVGVVDTDELLARVSQAAQAFAPGSSLSTVEPLQGGSSSLTYRATLEGGPVDVIVVKVAPPGVPPVRNRDVLRQARVLQALGGVPGVPVPEVYFSDEGDPPDVPPFFAMSYVEGESFEPILNTEGDPSPEDLRARALTSARVLADLQAADPRGIGLAGEPEVDLAGEIERWVRLFATVDDELKPRSDEAAQALHDTMPAALPSVVLHGDYRLGNMQCVGPEIRAIIDWEIWSPSDPRIDVTWWLMFTDQGHHPAARRQAAPGMLSADELLAAYTEARGAPLPDLDWFHALTRFKEAAATALIVKHLRRRQGVVAADEFGAGQIPQLIVDTLTILGRD